MSNTQRISRATVIDMVAKNASNIEIAAAVGCSGSTVTKLRKSLGLEPASKSLGDWSEARIASLRKWWELDGLTASQIAAKFGGVFSRNGVMGKIHRLDLKARPSPIDRSGKARKVDNNPRGMLQTRLSRAADADRKPHVGANTFIFAARSKQAQTAPSAKAELAHAVPPKTPATRESETKIERSPSVPHPATRGVPFAELDARGCKWATTPHHVAPDSHLFCNERRHGSGPWCPRHAVAAKGRDANPVPVSQRATA